MTNANSKQLTSVSIYAISSSNCGWVLQPPSQPVCKHGGPQLRVVILENGYSSNRIAWVNAGLLPARANYFNEGICTVAGVQKKPCPNGRTITSWLRYYDLDAYASQLPNIFFQYQATSSTPTTNTYSVSSTIP